MRTSGRCSIAPRETSVVSDVFKSLLLLTLIGEVMFSVSPLPQSRNLHFPSNQQVTFVSKGNELVPFNDSPPSTPSSVFQVGTTGINCDSPGKFVKAPDGCNSCFCAENRQLSSACSRVYCPPGFPSYSPEHQRP